MLQFANLAWLVLLLPLLAAVGITLFTLRQRELSAKLSIAGVSLAFLCSIALFLGAGQTGAQPASIQWLSVGGLDAGLNLVLDPLSQLMLLIVTGVGMLIHIYSYGYMHEDRSISRYFASLSLFTFSMLGIVLAGNLVMMFIFWELVGVSSYLLIGFWHQKESAADACKKAFLCNRLGDFGFVLGILMLWAASGTVDFALLKSELGAHPEKLGSLIPLAGLLIFCGAMGKSAQFPLHVWLPDAMEGPTPVSALIHAATMVAAGVYMLCRTFFLFAIPATVWPESLSWLQGISSLDIIAWIGGLTALLAALMAVQQDDIKRILAYSTLSQLGYMVMAVGLGGPSAAMFHLATHAFFKAMLFLGAGAVIHACHHEQDIWKMGGIKQRMPVTFWTFLIGTLALCGAPPFSGFYSKDAILATAFDHHVGLFLLAVGVAALTAFYMSRLVIVAFLGEARTDHAAHAHEVSGVMAWPLRILAVPSVIAGVMGIDHFVGGMFPVSGHADHHAHASWIESITAPFGHSPAAAFLGLLAALAGFSVAWACYAGGV
ncbi:MAG: NADH-quinone oxidoreductase subunit L, partial [Verrucomicrobia bacterium]|nr:NADH-quinone oxidoreductase subunit L [Verrucomicrobiota bacterium]